MRSIALVAVMEDGSPRSVATKARQRLELHSTEPVSLTVNVIRPSKVAVNLSLLSALSATFNVSPPTPDAFPFAPSFTKALTISGLSALALQITVADMVSIGVGKSMWWLTISAAGRVSIPILMSPLVVRT